jgi:hypothetical protein
LKSLEVLGELVDRITSQKYSPPTSGSLMSVPQKHTYIEGEPKVYNKRAEQELKNLDEDIWRLIDCYNTRDHFNGRRPGRCRHKWLKFCSRCGERYEPDKF